jgi:hypothetical protein
MYFHTMPNQYDQRLYREGVDVTKREKGKWFPDANYFFGTSLRSMAMP